VAWEEDPGEARMPTLKCPECGKILDDKEILRERNRVGNYYLGCCEVAKGGCGVISAFEIITKRDNKRRRRYERGTE